MLVSFDDGTRTEATYDYVKFYKDDGHDVVWGAEKYSGDASSGNWPGLGGRPPLEIMGDTFVFHFKSDGSRTDWGYRVRVRPTLTAVAQFSVGDVVKAHWKSLAWSKGKVSKVNSDGTLSYDVAFDDGDREANMEPARVTAVATSTSHESDSVSGASSPSIPSGTRQLGMYAFAVVGNAYKCCNRA